MEPDSGVTDAERLEKFRRETVARRERAKRIPWQATPTGAWFAARADEWANDDPDSPENRAAVARAQRFMKRKLRAEARRMTLAKYQAQLERKAERMQRDQVRSAAQAELAAASAPRRPTAQRSRSRRHRPTGRARARSPGREDPEPSPALTADARRLLREAVSRARHLQAQRLDAWRLCRRCEREKEPEEFGAGCSYCRSCESERVREYQRARRRVPA